MKTRTTPPPVSSLVETEPDNLALLQAQRTALEAELSATLLAIDDCNKAASPALSGDAMAMLEQLKDVDAAIHRRAELNTTSAAIQQQLALLTPVIEQLERQREEETEQERQRIGRERMALAGEKYAAAFDALLAALVDYGKGAIAANQQGSFIAPMRHAIFPRLGCVPDVERPGIIKALEGYRVNPHHEVFNLGAFR